MEIANPAQWRDHARTGRFALVSVDVEGAAAPQFDFPVCVAGRDPAFWGR